MIKFLLQFFFGFWIAVVGCFTVVVVMPVAFVALIVTIGFWESIWVTVIALCLLVAGYRALETYLPGQQTTIVLNRERPYFVLSPPPDDPAELPPPWTGNREDR